MTETISKTRVGLLWAIRLAVLVAVISTLTTPQRTSVMVGTLAGLGLIYYAAAKVLRT